MHQITIEIKDEARILLNGLPVFITTKYNMAAQGIYCLGKWELSSDPDSQLNTMLSDEQETNLHFFPYTSVLAILIAQEPVSPGVTKNPLVTG